VNCQPIAENTESGSINSHKSEVPDNSELGNAAQGRYRGNSARSRGTARRHRLFALRPANGSGRHPNHRVTTIWHSVSMSDEHSSTSRQADQLRTDIANVGSGLEVIMKQVARLPTRKESAPKATASEIGDPGEDERVRLKRPIDFFDGKSPARLTSWMTGRVMVFTIPNQNSGKEMPL
jgi:hypothetical protein